MVYYIKSPAAKQAASIQVCPSRMDWESAKKRWTGKMRGRTRERRYMGMDFAAVWREGKEEDNKDGPKQNSEFLYYCPY